MRKTQSIAVLVALLLSCATPPASSANAQPQDESNALPKADWDDLNPIRFGDPVETYTREFFPGTKYSSDVALPAQVLGQPVGSRPAHPAEIVDVFRNWAEHSPLLQLKSYAHSFEGRPLVRAVITSEANHARLDEILSNLAQLADPRGLSDSAADELIRSTPASAWLGYSIHGDEISGADASMAVAYHLIAAESEEVKSLLNDLIIVIDPVMNPDGRERFISQLEQTRGYVPNMDYASMQRGRWPEGRGNHYLFDMNRDWIAGVAPETRGRWHSIREFNPQLFVDAHEMWALDTFLFYPQSPAHNPHLPSDLNKWQNAFAKDQGSAFDSQGWGFYTREWADAWAPFYSDAWGSLSGAIGILYEMASTDGQPVRRESGEVVSYRQGVHRQAVSSISNLRTLHQNREAVLSDFVASKRANLEAEDRWFVCKVGRNRDREDQLLRILIGQGLEVRRVSDSGLKGQSVVSALGKQFDEIEIPVGSLLVAARQPLGPLVKSYLDFDIRMSEADLRSEREELEQKGRSKIYDITAWGLGHALDLDAYWCELSSNELPPLVTEVPVRSGSVTPAEKTDYPATAWVVDGADDSAVLFAAQALELGLSVHISDTPFSTAGRSFSRGSLLLRRHENEADALEERIAKAASLSGVEVIATSHARSPDDGPDLGGGHFTLLARPRIAVLANSPVSRDTFGHIWYLLDHELKVPYSLLDATSFGAYDLRRYNVLVLPPAGGSLRSILADNKDALQTWVRAGGTLIACGSSAAALANEQLGISNVRLRRNVIDDLNEYADETTRAREARTVTIDEALLWDGVASSEPDHDESIDDDSVEAPKPVEITDKLDSWMRRFSPAGVFLRGEVNALSWLSSGINTDEMPVYAAGSSVFMAKAPAQVAVRFGAAETLRLSGLLWPEARERAADSAYATVESKGNGQVILFATVPGYRGYFKGTARLLVNALIFGPGAGANPPVNW
ncbi:MAG: hypothetical protein ACI8TQ_000133 [Planctomycetota bacterium]|jgi:hypothetical protein